MHYQACLRLTVEKLSAGFQLLATFQTSLTLLIRHACPRIITSYEFMERRHLVSVRTLRVVALA